MNSLEANIDTDRATVANYSTAKAKLDAEKNSVKESSGLDNIKPIEVIEEPIFDKTSF